MLKPFFSIIVPTYNRAYILWKTLQSIQAQIWPHWECIVVDDGSSDDTQKMLAEFRDDPRFCVVYQKNRGVSSARNLGASQARGDILTYIDSDDPVFPQYLTTAIRYFTLNPDKYYAVSHCNFVYEFYDSEHQLISVKSAAEQQTLQVTLEDLYYWRHRVAIGTGLFLRYEISQAVRWNESILAGEDIDYIMSLAELYPSKFMFIPEAVFIYRQRYGSDGACSQMSYANWADFFEEIYELHRHDKMMSDPTPYLARIEKYRKLQQAYEQSTVHPPQYKYFPELWNPDGSLSENS